jgi:uncharacterized SAM-binding protein YcdF (DUF218 family)
MRTYNLINTSAQKDNDFYSILSTFAFMKRSITVGKSVKYGSYGILLIILSVIIHSYYCYLYVPSSTFNKIKNQQYDAIIVPGVPYDANNWSVFLKWRIHWSAFLYKQGVAKNIIYSGSAVHTAYTEASIMKKFGEKLGISSSNIFIEHQAEHSSENLYYSYIMAKEKGFKRLALATDPFQSDMLDDFIEEYNLDIDLIPIVYSIADTINMIQPAIDFESEFIENFTPLSDRENLSERMSGTRGEKIDWSKIEDL